MSARVRERPVREDLTMRARARYAKLPAGVHGIAPEVVRADQTARLQAAIVELVAERGYGAVSVADVLARAAVSRRTFYEHYANKQACFIATYDAIVEDWATGAATAQQSGAGWGASLRNSLMAIVDRVVADPVGAHVVFVEALSAGAQALERRTEAVAAFERLTRQSLQMAPGGAQMRPAMFKVLVGGVREIIANRLRDDRVGDLPKLADPLTEWMLCYRSVAATEILDAADTAAAANGRARPAGTADRADPPEALATPPGAWLWLEDSAQPVVWLSPRDRILAAVTEIVLGKGWEALSVAEIARVARTTHQTFNKLFASKEEAFLAAYDAGMQEALAGASDAAMSAASWPAAVHESLAAEAEFLASHPDIARFSFLEFYAAGPEALDRREAPLQVLKDRLTRGVARNHRGKRPPSIAVEAVTGGILALMRDTVLNPGPEQLPSIVPDATFTALAPFMGAKAAAIEATRPRNE
jgi:AcrR family transcriptional regulator